MFVKKYIQDSISKLDGLYQDSVASSDLRMAVYYSKLAVIEYCGWIEESMDEIVNYLALGGLKTQSFRDILAYKIRHTYGFDYKKHFRPMIVDVVGLRRCEYIQDRLHRNGDLDILTSELETYVGHRNNAAHTHIHSTLPTYPSPSVTMNSLNRVFPILRRIRRMKKDKKCV